MSCARASVALSAHATGAHNNAQDCVCSVDAFCCEEEWDSTCAQLAIECGDGCELVEDDFQDLSIEEGALPCSCRAQPSKTAGTPSARCCCGRALHERTRSLARTRRPRLCCRGRALFQPALRRLQLGRHCKCFVAPGACCLAALASTPTHPSMQTPRTPTMHPARVDSMMLTSASMSHRVAVHHQILARCACSAGLRRNRLHVDP